MNATGEVDVLVYGDTAPALVAAVRAAREGLTVELVTPAGRLGGALPSLGAVETHYRGVRAPLLQEFIDQVQSHYRETYGDGSEQYRACCGGMMVTFEPKVAEKILRDWILAETRIHWRPGYQPAGVERSGSVVRAVTFAGHGNGGRLRIAARSFIEGSYEGDLMAAAGAEFRIGRESRTEHGEPSAGRVFTRWLTGEFPRAAVRSQLNLTTSKATTSAPLPESTGEGDDNIQSYSFRLCLTADAANRRLLEAPPAGYDREKFTSILLSPTEKERLPLPFHHRFLIYDLHEMVERDHIFHGHALPNRKRSWNATNFTGAGKPYAGASAAERRAIECAHRDHALGLMWFLQNDPAMPPDLRERAREWGLARDEFTETSNLPPQLYVREARRLVGRAVFTEHDARANCPAGGGFPVAARPCHLMDDNSAERSAGANGTEPGEVRAPIHADSIAITEFSLDSLACTVKRVPGQGALCDGQLFQMEVSRPAQVPFGVLLPRTIDNLLVVTTVSATHVGWGTIRQTPTLMHLAESAAWAVVLAARANIVPAALDVSRLQRQLVEQGIMISFFNDFDMACSESWVPAVQYFGTRGFFPDYDARPMTPLDASTEADWRARVAALQAGLEIAGNTRAAALESIYRRTGAPATLQPAAQA